MAKKPPTSRKAPAPRPPAALAKATSPTPPSVVLPPPAPEPVPAPEVRAMPNIVLQGIQQSTKQRLEQPDARRGQTVSVGASPGRLHYVTTRGVTRCYERVGVTRSGEEIYRDQTRY